MDGWSRELQGHPSTVVSFEGHWAGRPDLKFHGQSRQAHLGTPLLGAAVFLGTTLHLQLHCY